jgi:hypothetical protein
MKESKKIHMKMVVMRKGKKTKMPYKKV